jgi:hypothetical protein
MVQRHLHLLFPCQIPNIRGILYLPLVDLIDLLLHFLLHHLLMHLVHIIYHLSKLLSPNLLHIIRQVLGIMNFLRHPLLLQDPDCHPTHPRWCPWGTIGQWLSLVTPQISNRMRTSQASCRASLSLKLLFSQCIQLLSCSLCSLPSFHDLHNHLSSLGPLFKLYSS